MKNFRNILALLVVFAMIGCTEDFLDINEDPNVPFTPEVDQLMASAIASTAIAQYGQAGNTGFINSALNVYSHQLVARENPDQYGMPASSVLISNTWNTLYTGVIPNLDAIIEAAQEEESGRFDNTAAAAKILKAHVFSTIVDLWANVPFSEANQNVAGIIHPRLDNGADVYNGAFDLLEEALAMLDAEGTDVLGDMFYNGNPEAWTRLGHSIMLNMLNKTRKAQGDINGWSDKMSMLVAAHNNADVDAFILENESFEFWYNESATPDQRHPGFASGGYTGGQLTQYISPWIYEIMSGQNLNATDNPFAGNPDPRRHYYWVRQLTPGADPDNPWEYRDGQFVSIFFGSIGPNRDMGQDAAASTVGLFPVGGKYDDGAGGKAGIADGTGVAPAKLFTYPDLLFVMAELSHTEGIDFGMSTADLLEAALNASMVHVESVINQNIDGVPSLLANPDLGDFIAGVVSTFDNADADRQLEIIMTQKWISAFYNGVQNYTDIRRTGFPVLFDPNGDSLTPDPYEEGENIVPTQLTRSFPVSLWYPTQEVERNPNVDQKPNQVDVPVFWDK